MTQSDEQFNLEYTELLKEFYKYTMQYFIRLHLKSNWIESYQKLMELDQKIKFLILAYNKNPIQE